MDTAHLSGCVINPGCASDEAKASMKLRILMKARQELLDNFEMEQTLWDDNVQRCADELEKNLNTRNVSSRKIDALARKLRNCENKRYRECSRIRQAAARSDKRCARQLEIVQKIRNEIAEVQDYCSDKCKSEPVRAGSRSPLRSTIAHVPTPRAAPSIAESRTTGMPARAWTVRLVTKGTLNISDDDASVA